MRTSFLSRVFNQSSIFYRNLHISRIVPGKEFTLNALHTFFWADFFAVITRLTLLKLIEMQCGRHFINSYIVIVTTCSIFICNCK